MSKRFEKALFLKRLNRFTLECEKDGKTFRAYLPNSGRLWELLLPGKTLILQQEKEGKLPVVWASERAGHIICLHTHYTNVVAEELIRAGHILPLSHYTIRAREFKVDNQRVDFLLEKDSERLLLEVKSCTLFHENIAMFPDAITARGKRHLELLSANKGAILFLVHNPLIDYFLPDFHTDPIFSETLLRVKDRIIIKAVSIRWNEDMEFQFIKELSIPWHVYLKEAANKGSYILTGALKGDISLEIGSLGKTSFRRGYYIYIGSAMNSLCRRIARHKRREKIKRWHIDFLIPHLQNLREIPIRSSEKLECKISKEMEGIMDGYIKDFGSSDCKCKSHLYFTNSNPLDRPEFIDLILHFRIGRLKSLI